MSTQDDDLKLEPPQGQQTPSPQPPAPAPQPSPPAPVYSPPGQPAQGPPVEADSGLEPGAGKPLVEGPPMSVGAPVSDAAVNRTAAFFGIGLLGVGVIVALVLLLVIVFAVCHH